MQRCSKKAYAMCPTRHLCGPVEEATFTEDSECSTFNREVADKPMTNADHIRAMSDEELAVFLSRDLKETCDYCQLAVFEGACTETLCDDAMMKWLRQPAEEDDHE